MNSMKTNLALPFLLTLLSILFFRCSSTITLENVPSDLVLVTISPNNDSTVSYEYHTFVPEPFVYSNSIGYKYRIPINNALKSNIESYMQTKFNKLLVDQSHNNNQLLKIIYELKTFSVDYHLGQNPKDIIVSVLGDNGLQGTATVESKLVLNINVLKDGTVINETFDLIGHTRDYLAFP